MLHKVTGGSSGIRCYCCRYPQENARAKEKAEIPQIIEEQRELTRDEEAEEFYSRMDEARWELEVEGTYPTPYTTETGDTK